jgi:putative cardiolipin synthase
MGLLIDSPEIVSGFTDRADERLANLAYRVVLNDQGQLEWHGRVDGEDVIETHEPLASPWLRFKAWILRIAPESQL